MRELGSNDRRYAYRALRAVLHVLRDRLPVDESAQLAAQLPELVRGVYYEGWRPSATPQSYHDARTLLDRVAAAAQLHGETEASFAAEAVARLLRRRVSAGEIADVLAVLPAEVRALFAGWRTSIPRPGVGVRRAAASLPAASGGEPLGVVRLGRRDRLLTAANGAAAFAAQGVEASQGWFDQAVATVARRHFLRPQSGREERSLRALLERVLGAIARWRCASAASHRPGDRPQGGARRARLDPARDIRDTGLAERGDGRPSPHGGQLHLLGRRQHARAARLERQRGAHLPARGGRQDEPVADPLLTRTRLARRTPEVARHPL